MLLISGNRTDDFDIVTTTISSRTSTSSGRCRGNSGSPPPSPSSFSSSAANSNHQHQHGHSFHVRKPSLNHLSYSQDFVEFHLNKTAEIKSNFEIRKVLLVGACRKFRDFLLNYKKTRSDEVLDFIHTQIDFIRNESKKLSLTAETIYITCSYSWEESYCPVIGQMEILNDIVAKLSSLECEGNWCQSNNSKQHSILSGYRSSMSSSSRFYYDFERASQALEPMDELELDRGISLLLLKRSLERNKNNSSGSLMCMSEANISDRNYLQDEIGLLPQEFEHVLFKFACDQKSTSFSTNLNELSFHANNY